MDGWISTSQILVLIYQGLYENHSFIIRRSWDWIQINETSVEFGSQSRSWINIKTKTKQKNTQTNKEKTKPKRQKPKQNKNNYAHCDFPGYTKCGKNILWLFSLWFFFYRRNTYLRYYIEHRHYININSIHAVNDKQKIVNVKFPPPPKKKGKQFGLLFSWTDFAMQLQYCWTQD